MIFPWGRQEVLVTNSAERFGVAQRVLRNEGVAYSTRMVNGGSSSRRMGTVLGRFGERMDLETVYYIYVGKADAERAQYLINRSVSDMRAAGNTNF